MMERMGLEVIVIDSPWGEGANEEKLAEILKVKLKKLLVLYSLIPSIDHGALRSAQN